MKKIVSLKRKELESLNKNSENRLVNHGHKNKIKRQMELSLDYFAPITVNEITSNVIDGQHRLVAFKELIDEGKLPGDSTLDIKYLNIPLDKEKEAIVNANINNKNWSLDDYIFSFSKKNNNYSLLIDWCSNHPLCIGKGNKFKYRYGAAMLVGKGCNKELKDGSFIISQEDLNRGEIVHDELVDILEILGKKQTNPFIEALAVSWISVRHLHPYSEWRKEIKNKKNMLMKKPSENQKEWNEIFGTILRSIELKKTDLVN